MTNPVCRVCSAGYETINGRRCRILDLKVEYSPAPPCKELSKGK